MNRISITAGTGYTKDGRAISREELAQALAVIRARLVGKFGGYTETETYGGWLAPGGELVVEPGRRWIVLVLDTATDDKAADMGRTFADMIRRELDQEAVILEVEPLAVLEFVDAETLAEVTA